MNEVQRLHQKAMDLAEQAEVAKRRGESHDQVQALLRQAFEQETQAADHLVEALDIEPTRSVLHRSAASLAIDCGEFQIAERLITRALTGNPPAEIAAELKDLFVQINLPEYFERRGLH
jgi:tetratricopeptide (TPR) repeat protein